MISQTGLGLRTPYIQELLENNFKSIHWLEFLADQYYQVPEFVLKKLDQLREIYPCVLHSVNLSLGSAEEIPEIYLKFLNNLISRYEPAWISDHLCISRVKNIFTHDLLPIIYSQKNLDLIARRIDFLQEKFKKLFLIENISSYINFNLNKNLNIKIFSEAEFLKKLVNKTGCGILLDINNLVLSSENHGLDYQDFLDVFLDKLDFKAIKQIHLAGAEYHQGIWIDTHSREIGDKTWQVFKKIQETYGPIPTCLEWDNDLPEFNKILKEAEKIEVLIPVGRADTQVRPYKEFETERVRADLRVRPDREVAESGEIINLDCESAWFNFLNHQPEDLYELINPAEKGRMIQGLKIYKNSIQGTLRKNLVKTYKTLEKILGPEKFNFYINKYAEQNFSDDFNLNSYGEKFSELFELIYLKELAEFCYAWRQVYTQEEMPGMILNFQMPVYELWKYGQPEDKNTKLDFSDFKLGQYQYLLAREGHKVRVLEMLNGTE